MATAAHILLGVTLLQCVHSLHYRPDVDQQSFQQGDPVFLKYNSLTSIETLIPLDPYSLPICQPEGGPRLDSENIGEFLRGDRIESSPIQLRFKEDMYCQQLCITNLGREEVPGMAPNKMAMAIQKGYKYNAIVDNLPAASKMENDVVVVTKYWQGFPLGYLQDVTNLAHVNNHFNIEIMYTPVEGAPNAYNIVRFTVEPFSIGHDFEPYDYSGPTYARIINPIQSCSRQVPPRDRVHTNYDMIYFRGGNRTRHQIASGQILFTYDVLWIENKDQDWASRWDIYLSMDNGVPKRNHWRCAILGLLLVIILSGCLSCIPIVNLGGSRKPIYGSLSTAEDGPSNTGWKALHEDVFRPPEYFPLLFCVACGTGAQLFCTMVIVAVLAFVGTLSSARRGSIGTAEIFFYAANGYVGGYVTSTLDQTFHAEGGRRAALYTASVFPGLCFMGFLLVDLMEWATIPGAVSMIGNNCATYIILLFLWSAMLTPLVLLGARRAAKTGPIEFPVETSANTPRRIPEQPCILLKPIPIIFGGFGPFLISFVELYYCLYSKWAGYFYAEYGFLLWTLINVFISTSQIAMLHTYHLLKKENHRWWWRSFFTGGAAAIWASAWMLTMLPRELELSGFASKFKYMTFTLLMVVAMFMMTGSFAVGACLMFNKALFNSIKNELGNVEARIELLPTDDHEISSRT
ncbi:unnamed protein product [Cylindrotheca closterium]|uniref:Transmembrane 9 superfamily member n=1 Tax=Cylindrotheca closterium TaxID=2856 RepID=A0AAD2FFL7_9STRA|nr:unnamed protein product [Cylindrotheca closterium]